MYTEHFHSTSLILAVIEGVLWYVKIRRFYMVMSLSITFENGHKYLDIKFTDIE